MSRSLSRRLFDYGLLVLALAAGAWAIWMLRVPRGFQLPPVWVWGVLVGAGVVGGVALRRMEAWLPDGRLPARRVDPSTGRSRQVGFLYLVVAAAITGWVVVRLWPNFRNWQGTPLPWLIAMLLTFAGAWLLRAIGEPATPDRCAQDAKVGSAEAVPRWVEVTAFLSIAVLALVLRTYRISEIPAGIYVDETNGAMDSLYILEGRGDSPFATGWYESPNAFAYYMALLFKLFGATHGSLKAVSVIPAFLTVLAVYPLGRVLFGPSAAIAAMLFMAVSRWHLTMSRWGWAEIAPPVFQVLATFFLWRGLRDRRATDFALGGLISGLMVYTYLSSRLALAVLGFFALYWMLVDRNGPLTSWKRHWRQFVLFLFGFLVAVAPIAVTYLANPFSFLNRITEINIFNEVREAKSYEPLIENVRRHVMFFHYRGDRSGKHNFPGEPETDPATGLLFVVGLGYGLFRLSDRRRGLLWLWMILAMAAGMLSVLHESPQAFRTINAVPAIALLAGDVCARFARATAWLVPTREGVPTRRGLLRRTVAGLLFVVPLLFAAVWETRIYFGRQAESPAVKGSFNLTENWVAKEVIAALQRGTVVYLSPRFYDFTPLRFLVYGVMKAKTGENTLEHRPYQLARPEVDLPVPDTGTDAQFLLDSYYWSVKDYFLKFYPTAEFSLPPDPENRVLAVSVKVPRDAIAALHGLSAEFTTAGGQVERKVVPVVEEEWGTRDVTAARWSGGLRIERPGSYELSSDGALAIVVDDRPWAGKRFLGHGLHKLEVRQQRSAGQGVARLRWTPPQGEVATVPPSALFKVGPPREGLTARYYPNETWSGEPLYEQVTPFVLLFWPEGDPVYGPFSVRFTGALRIEKPGRYTFRVMADDGARLVIDGKVLGEGLEPLRANRFTASVDLSAGDHSLQLDYYQRGGSNDLEFYWQGPGDPSGGPVPPEVLVPEASGPAAG